MRIKYVIERVCCNLLSQVSIKEEEKSEQLDMLGFKDVIVGEVLKFSVNILQYWNTNILVCS